MNEDRTNEKEQRKNPHDGEYIGNIWGKKITLYGGLFMLFLLAVIIYRHLSMGVPFGLEETELEEAKDAAAAENEVAPADTLNGKQKQ